MATTVSTLIQRTRRFVRDWPDLDATAASLTSAATTVSVADSTAYSLRWPIEIDQEVLLVTSLASSTTLTVRRGMYGSTAASHAASANILIRPAFYAVEYIDALNEAKDDAFPLIYKPVLDTSLTGDGLTYEFTVPNMPTSYGGDTITIPYISKIEVKQSGDTAYRENRRWEIRRGATPKIKFRQPPDTSDTVRVHGLGPFPNWTAATDSVEALFPKNAENLLPLGAASFLLASGEAGRVRQDVGARDDREAAVRPGSSMNVSNSLYSRWRIGLQGAAMRPLPPHIVGTF